MSAEEPKDAAIRRALVVALEPLTPRVRGGIAEMVLPTVKALLAGMTCCCHQITSRLSVCPVHPS